MPCEILIKRYNAYYQGWCQAFGEHEANIELDREIYWLVRQDRIGLAVSPALIRKLNHIFLGHHNKNPELIINQQCLQTANQIIYRFSDQVDIDGMHDLVTFLNSRQQFHLYLSSHFCYPRGTRIITFSSERPTILLYKEMLPLKLMIE